MSKRVPQDGRGASRRAYHAGYSKGAKQKASRAAGPNRPRTAKASPPSNPTPPRSSREEYSKGGSASFGNTGNVEDIDV